MMRAAIAVALLAAACSHSAAPRQYRSAADVRSRFDCVNRTITYHDDSHPEAGLDSRGFVSVDGRGNPVASSIGCPQDSSSTKDK